MQLYGGDAGKPPPETLMPHAAPRHAPSGDWGTKATGNLAAEGTVREEKNLAPVRIFTKDLGLVLRVTPGS